MPCSCVATFFVKYLDHHVTLFTGLLFYVMMLLCNVYSSSSEQHQTI